MLWYATACHAVAWRPGTHDVHVAERAVETPAQEVLATLAACVAGARGVYELRPILCKRRNLFCQTQCAFAFDLRLYSIGYADRFCTNADADADVEAHCGSLRGQGTMQEPAADFIDRDWKT